MIYSEKKLILKSILDLPLSDLISSLEEAKAIVSMNGMVVTI